MSHGYEQKVDGFQSPKDSEPPPLFLDVFRQNNEPRLLATEVRFDTVLGTVSGYLVRPDVREPLPAVLLISGEEKLNDWMRENAHDLSGIGYVVLAVATNRATASGEFERSLAQFSAAVRWLRRRADVLPAQVGVVGWSRGADMALELSAAVPLQACVICDGSLHADRALLGGLRGTPVLVVAAAKDKGTPEVLPRFEEALVANHIVHRVRVLDGVGAGFMTAGRDTPARKAADQAYFEMYEFLGKYVETSPSVLAAKFSPGFADEPVATIADIMRAVNDAHGVRGDLIKALEQEPNSAQQWRKIRADAAVLAEAGKLLEKRTPPKGLRQHWLEQSRSFASTAAAAVAAAERRDYAGTLRSLQSLKTQCASCHEQHR
jgi:dienelactone hydrolase